MLAAVSAKPASSGCPKSRSAKGAWTDDGRLLINVGTAADFEKLPGIGTKRAAAIVALRERLGGFRRTRDLMRVRGIGFRSMQKLAPLIVLGSREKSRPD